MDFSLLVHLVGLIIGLGAVTVIDVLGFRSRNSRKLTQVTIHAHHTTKPLIWLGTILVLVSFIFLYDFSFIANLKLALLFVMILNGSFLSFYVSPRLDMLIGKNILLSKNLQLKIKISMIISVISWWTFVVLTWVSV